MLTGHPTLFEELNRKATDALVWLTEAQELGDLRPDQVYAAKQALFIALAGLLRPDINELLSASAVAGSSQLQEVCFKNGRIAIVTLNPSGSVTLYRAGLSPDKIKVDQFKTQDAKKSMQVLKRVRTKLLEDGYQLFEHGVINNDAA